MATLATPVVDLEIASNRRVVKTVIDHANYALWFSRHPIPSGGPWLKHIEIYAYTPKFLRRLPTMTKTTASGEFIDQLRWLQAGYKVRVLVDDVTSISINSQESYARFVANYVGL